MDEEKGTFSEAGSASAANNGQVEDTISRKKKTNKKTPRNTTIRRSHGCQKCRKSFPTLYKLITHQRKHTGEKPFHCDKCAKTFSVKSNLARHRKLIHSPEQLPKLPCPVCGKVFNFQSNLRYHQMIHQKEKPYSCVFCPKKFRQKGHLHVHTISHLKEKSFFCDLCSGTYSTKEGMQIHHRRHTGEVRFKCPHPNCTLEFYYRPLFIAHRRQFHKENFGIGYTCVFCNDGFEFLTKVQRDNHVRRTHLSEKGYFCRNCDMCFVTSEERLKHSRNIHDVGGKKRFRCTFCDMAFYTWANLSAHIGRLHSNQTAD